MAQEMTITRALNELKLLDKRINDKIASSVFIGTSKKSSDKVNNISRSEFEKNAKSNFESIKDLIERRKKIKEAIVAKNAETIVKIGSKEMTVASAIERKYTIEYDKSLLLSLEDQYRKAEAFCNEKNDKVERDLINLINTTFGSKEKADPNALDGLTNNFRKLNEWELIDPLKLKKVIEDLKNEIDEFESNVDLALSEINAITKIIID